MEKGMILETAWNTIWNANSKRVYVGSLSEFTGYEHYFEALTHIRTKALEAFAITLEEHYLAFGEDLWREIFGQIMLPLLEDIKVQIEVLRKKNTLNNEQ